MEIGLARSGALLLDGANQERPPPDALLYTTVELDLTTLVWTRGENFPINRLNERLRCPCCRLMKVRVYFDVPNQPNAGSVAAE